MTPNLLLAMMGLFSAFARCTKVTSRQLITIPEDEEIAAFTPIQAPCVTLYDYERFRGTESGSLRGETESSEGLGADLILACRTGNLEQLELALDQPDCSRDDVQNALIETALSGQLEALLLLLQDPRADPDFSSSPFQAASSCLEVAIDADHLEIVQALLADGRIDISSNRFYNLRHAYSTGRTSIVKVILQHPATNLTEAYQALMLKPNSLVVH